MTDTGTSHEGCLSGVSIIWIGSRDAAGLLLGALERAGAVVQRLPVVEFGAPADERRVEQILGELDHYSWVLFTSGQAVRSVAGRARPKTRVAAVGPATEALLCDHGWKVDLVPERNDASGLADALVASGPVPREPVLFIRGNQARRTLPDRLVTAGFAVEEVEVYSTHPVDLERVTRVVDRIDELAEVVIAGSPLGVKTLARAAAPRRLGRLKSGLKWICLGRTTRDALVNEGVEDAVFPGKMTAEQLVESVVDLIQI